MHIPRIEVVLQYFKGEICVKYVRYEKCASYIRSNAVYALFSIYSFIPSRSLTVIGLHLETQKAYGQPVLDIERALGLRIFRPKQITLEMPTETP
jgi:hypothetical protein